VTTTDQTIAEHVAAFTAGLSGQIPDGVLDVFREDQANLDAAGPPSGIAAPGTPMPDGQLLDVHGEATTLTGARGGRRAVVVFYRGAWCPYCNVALRVYQQQLAPALAERDIALIAVSPQKPDGSLTMREKNELTYTVVSDPGNQIAGQLGILFHPRAETRAAQAKLGIVVADGNGDGTDITPMPAVVLVDTDGTVRWIDVHPNYTTRTEPTEILDAIGSVFA
jgi:peroxiredoxin